ncbi:MAG TPA: ABC-F family ATP-binding cassette domain-containing protein [Bacillota bacterium]|nr:ABC-F family ATP-binding cassette domain-containing protein [Bacillota bacterium]
MIEININKLIKYYGANKIFENISFSIKTGDRVGLIGKNGCGKTSLIKILMGIEDYQGGDINIRKGADIGWLEQVATYGDHVSTMDVILSAFDDLFHLRGQLKKLEQRMSAHDQGSKGLEKDLESYGELTARYELEGGYEVDTRVGKITSGLKISDQLKELKFNQLSGGEKTRVLLAKTLLEEPDILLLDEPTNHLDLPSVEWLEDFLKQYKGSVLIISHDRYFLDNVVKRIIELEFDRANIYEGNYSYYTLEKERRFLLDLKYYQNQQKKIDRMEDQIKRYRVWGQMRDSEKMYKKAKELEKRLEKLERVEKPRLYNRKVRLNADSAGRSGRIVLELEGISKGFSEEKLLEDVGLTLFYQDSACILGENGTGKTTLLRIILDEIGADGGSVRVGSRVKIGYLPQMVSFEDEDMTVLDYFAREHGVSYGAARIQLSKALFYGEEVNKRIRSLSGGERSRLKLCSLTFDQVNLLILDEPTNHLDIDSREVLEQTLSEYEGTLLFVSHDRYFIGKLADKVIAIEDRDLKVYKGDYAYYRRELERLEAMEMATNTRGDLARTKSLGKANENKRPGRQSLAGARGRGKALGELEAGIEEKEQAIRQVTKMMNEHNDDVDKLQELYSERQTLEEDLEGEYKEWEELSSSH